MNPHPLLTPRGISFPARRSGRSAAPTIAACRPPCRRLAGFAPSVNVAGLVLTAAVVVMLALPAAPASADTFKLKAGNTIVGEIEKDLGDKYLVRVAVGVVEIDKKDIVTHTPGEVPWKLYEAEKKNHPDTADGHYALAQWCRKNSLREREIEHLRRAIELDPNHEAAHLALGHVKVKGAWIDPKKIERDEAKADPARADKQRQDQTDKLLRDLIAKWHVRVKAIYRERMEGKDADTTHPKFADGRKQILAIKDPLAIPAITGVLSRGRTASRRVMIEALSQFPQDEATMNLLVVAMLDPDDDIRKAAAIELIPRSDDRLVDQLRDALAMPDERTIRNAAATLGIVKARKAVPTLIEVLSRETKQAIVITRPVWVQRVRTVFGGTTDVRVGNGNYRYRPDGIGVLDPELLMGTETVTEVHIVNTYRTEVQEALIAITGQNFGFDQDEWRKWWNHAEKK